MDLVFGGFGEILPQSGRGFFPPHGSFLRYLLLRDGAKCSDDSSASALGILVRRKSEPFSRLQFRFFGVFLIPQVLTFRHWCNPRRVAQPFVLFFSQSGRGCPALAFFARAGSNDACTMSVSCPAACIALTPPITCTLSTAPASLIASSAHRAQAKRWRKRSWFPPFANRAKD